LLFEIAEQQLQLLDRAAQLLRGGAEPFTQQLRQARLQLLVAQHLLLQSIARRLHLGLPPAFAGASCCEVRYAWLSPAGSASAPSTAAGWNCRGSSPAR